MAVVAVVAVVVWRWLCGNQRDGIVGETGGDYGGCGDGGGGSDRGNISKLKFWLLQDYPLNRTIVPPPYKYDLVLDMHAEGLGKIQGKHSTMPFFDIFTKHVLRLIFVRKVFIVKSNHSLKIQSQGQDEKTIQMLGTFSFPEKQGQWNSGHFD